MSKDDIIGPKFISLECDVKREIKNCMGEYAAQEAMGFAEWVDAAGYTKLQNGYWGSWSDFADNKTTQDLYNLYLKSKEQQ